MKKELRTYEDYLNAGWRDGDTKWTRGYISRKIDSAKQPVWTAGGRRNGEKFVELPAWKSTRFCVRQYLVAPEM